MMPKKIRVLLAENADGQTAKAIRALYVDREGKLELTLVSTIATLLPTIKVVEPDVILLDLSLNLREPGDAVHLVHRTAPGVPIIVVADVKCKDEAARTLTQGALDYLLKEYIDGPALDRGLRTALERNTLHALTDMMRDPVTELYTRDGFCTVGTRRLEEAFHANSSLVLICALFENLQTLQQRFGSSAADQAICDLAGLLKQSCRRSDVVGRLGAAQLAILGVDAVAPSAEVMRNRLLQHVIVHNRTRSPWGPIELRTSIGSWCATDVMRFPEFLDSVESQLRLSPVSSGAEYPQ